MSRVMTSWILVISMIVPMFSSVITARATSTTSTTIPDEQNYGAMTIQEIMKLDESLTWVFAGDSITHNSHFTMGMNGHSDWFEQYLNGIQIRQNDDVVNSAWGGADIRDFLTVDETPSGNGTDYDAGQGVENFITKYNPDVVFIKLGMNNRGMARTNFINYYKQMLDAIYEICESEYQKRPKVVLLSPSPMSGENFSDDKGNSSLATSFVDSTLDLRDDIATIAEEYAEDYGTLFCDLRTAFLNEQVKLGADYRHVFFGDSSDGTVHPNAAGQYLIFKTLSKTLGIYDEENPIYQISYEDFNSASLYVDDTYEVVYNKGYEGFSSEEMNKEMPSIDSLNNNLLASIDFDDTNGVFDGTFNKSVSLTDEELCENTLTLAEAKSLGKEFSVVFRAKLDKVSSSYQTVFYLSDAATAGDYKTGTVLGVPGTARSGAYASENRSNLTPERGSILVRYEKTIIGDWHTVALVQSESGFTVYVDGEVLGTEYRPTTSTYADNSTTTLNNTIGSYLSGAEDIVAYIGSSADNATSYNLKGNMDYYQLYDCAITQEQAQTLAAANASTATSVKTVSWSDAFEENSVWMIAGAEQMSGYEGTVVNRSLYRMIDNGIRFKETHRDIRTLDAAAKGYTIEKLKEEYENIIGENEHNVFMLLPEISQVYADNYEHTPEAVVAYKENVQELLAKEENHVCILWTPLASNDTAINSYITDYANAIREIAKEEDILFFDANRFMNDNMSVNASLLHNWFEKDMYVSPLCTTDLVQAFFQVITQEVASNTTGIAETKEHNLRYSSDIRVFKGEIIRDYLIPNDVTVSGEKVTVDISDIKAKYIDLESVSFAVMPYAGTGNYHDDIYHIPNRDVEISGNSYTFTAPCSNPLIAIYGQMSNGVSYRFKDFKVEVTASQDLTNQTSIPNGVYLDGLQVVGAPKLTLKTDQFEYDVNLYQYQSSVQILATAQDGLKIQVNEVEIESGVNSHFIDVVDGSKVTVKVSDTTNTYSDVATYTLNLHKPVYPDIIVTEVMHDGYYTEENGGGDRYDLIEIYNASGNELNLLDYSIGYKADFTKSVSAQAQDYPNYYFMGNNQALQGNSEVTQPTYTGINQITKYSSYWNNGSVTEPTQISFPANSTMVIWVLAAENASTKEQAKTFCEALTYDTLIETMKSAENVDKYVRSVDGEAVVPTENQLVIAEIPATVETESLLSVARNRAEDSIDHFYLGDHINVTATQHTRTWLYILNDEATQATNGSITEKGNDILSAAKIGREAVLDEETQLVTYDAGKENLSNALAYNIDRGMALVNGDASLTTFGAIEYWQKPLDLNDEEVPKVQNSTPHFAPKGSEAEIKLEVTDNKDVRYIELFVRKAGQDKYTGVVEDLVLKSGIANAGVSEDIQAYSYSYALGTLADTVEYYGYVYDGNNNITAFGTEEQPLTLEAKLVSGIKTYEYTYIDGDALDATIEKERTENKLLYAGLYDASVLEDGVELSELTKENAIREPKADTKYVIKFVPEGVLGIKAQISGALLADEDLSSSAIRFVTAVDSLVYKKVGFSVTRVKDGQPHEMVKEENVTNLVYRKLYGVDATTATEEELLEYSPTDMHADAQYFKTYKLTGVPSSAYDEDFTVTPYWITCDGVKVEGTNAIKTMNLGRSWYYVDANATNENALGTYSDPFSSIEKAIDCHTELAPHIILKSDIVLDKQITVEKSLTLKSLDDAKTITGVSGLTTPDAMICVSAKNTDAAITVNVDNVLFDGESIGTSGNVRALAVDSESADATLNILNTTIQNFKSGKKIIAGSSATTGKGGSLEVNGTVNFTNSTIKDGSNGTYKGGLVNVTSGTFNVNSGLICGNSTADTKQDTYSSANTRNGGCVGVDAGATFNLKGGTVSNGYVYHNGTYGMGGNVSCAGTFNMSGGLITQGRAKGVNTADDSGTGSGGNVYIGADGVFNLTGGEISDGRSLINTNKYGGGNIYVNQGQINISNATIKDGIAQRAGGNVFIYKAKNEVVIENTTISGGQCTSYYGGNIYSEGTALTLKGQTVIRDGYSNTQGGNISYASKTLTIHEGVQILNGQAKTYGGNVYLFASGSVTVAGGVITGGKENVGTDEESPSNLKMHAASEITFADEVAESTNIGVTLYLSSQSVAGVVATNAQEKYMGYLTPDNDKYQIAYADGQLSIANKPADKRAIFIGNSYVFYGNAVIRQDESISGQESRSGNEGYFYQLCKANGMDVSVTNWCFGGHGLADFFGATCTQSRCAAGTNHEEDLIDPYYDYVFVSPGGGARQAATLQDDFENIITFFTEANPNVKIFCLGNLGAHGYSSTALDLPAIYGYYKTLEEKGVIIADWGTIVKGIMEGTYAVPGALQTYTQNTFTIKDGYHPNPLTGYITSLVAYCAMTGESAVNQPYDFCDDATIDSEFDFDAYESKYYTSTYTTNFQEVFESETDMLGIQQLIDKCLEEKPYLDYEMPEINANMLTSRPVNSIISNIFSATAQTGNGWIKTSPRATQYSKDGCQYFSGLRGDKNEIASMEGTTKAGELTEAQKVDLADIGYGISAIGLSHMGLTKYEFSTKTDSTGYMTSLLNLVNGHYGETTHFGNLYFDNLTYNIKGEIDNESIYTGLLTLNFGSVKEFEAIGYVANTLNGMPKAQDVYVSDDGVNWTKVDKASYSSGTNLVSVAGNRDPWYNNLAKAEVLFSMNDVTGKYIRIGIIEGGIVTGDYAGIDVIELMVYGKEAAIDVEVPQFMQISDMTYDKTTEVYTPNDSRSGVTYACSKVTAPSQVMSTTILLPEGGDSITSSNGLYLKSGDVYTMLLIDGIGTSAQLKINNKDTYRIFIENWIAKAGITEYYKNGTCKLTAGIQDDTLYLFINDQLAGSVDLYKVLSCYADNAFYIEGTSTVQLGICSLNPVNGQVTFRDFSLVTGEEAEAELVDMLSDENTEVARKWELFAYNDYSTRNQGYNGTVDGYEHTITAQYGLTHNNSNCHIYGVPTAMPQKVKATLTSTAETAGHGIVVRYGTDTVTTRTYGIHADEKVFYGIEKFQWLNRATISNQVYKEAFQNEVYNTAEDGSYFCDIKAVVKDGYLNVIYNDEVVFTDYLLGWEDGDLVRLALYTCCPEGEDASYYTNVSFDAGADIEVSDIDREPADAVLLSLLSTKKISVLGDSISSYPNVSNGSMAATTNSTIKDNPYWYNRDDKHLDSWTKTYWGRMIEKYGMSLCVNNSVAGGWLTKDVNEKSLAGITRCTELHDNTGSDAGTEPDIIVAYMGTNDLINSVPVGQLTDATYSNVKNADGTYITPTTFTEGYIIMMDKMVNRYQKADVFCFTLLPTSAAANNAEMRSEYNARIKAIAQHYEATVVDIATEAGITNENYKANFIGSHPLYHYIYKVSKVFENALKTKYCGK